MAVDRIICPISPFFKRIDGEVHHHARHYRSPDLLGVGVLAGAALHPGAIFHALIGRNAINLHGAGSQQRVLYRSQDPA